MRHSTIIILIALIISTAAIGQTDSQKKAHELGMKAIKLMDAGEIKESIALLEQCRKLDSENIDYPYEIAYAYYQSKDYKQAINCFCAAS